MNPASRWRLAARLARREIRRHWARSAMVVAIIALPLVAAQATAISASITVDHATVGSGSGDGLDAYGQAEQTIGFDPRLGRPSEVSPTDDPTGRGLPVERIEVGFDIGDWTTAAPEYGRGPDDLTPLTAIALIEPEQVDLVDGRTPRTRHEAVVDTGLARRTGLEVGDELRLIASQVDLTVVGVADGNTGDPIAAVGPLAEGEEDWAVTALIRIRSVDQEQAQVHAGMSELYWYDSSAAAVDDVALARAPSARAETLVIGAVGGTIAVGFVAVTSSCAFAIGARRQLRQLGILSAAGAGPADLARSVVLQGSTLGIVGAVTATVLVYAGRAVGIRWIIEPAAEGGPIIPLAPFAVVGLAVLGVVAGTLAALVPALTASRIPVLSALAGRRPVHRRRMWSPWIGGLVLLGGLGALAAVTAGRHTDGTAARGSATGAALAVLAVMAGATAVAPAVIAVIARVTGRARGTARLAGRSLSRDRMRSSAVVAASAMALGLPVVLLLWTARDIGQPWSSPYSWTEETNQAFEDSLEQTETVSVYGSGAAIEGVRDRVHATLGSGTLESRPVVVEVEGEGEGLGPLGASATAIDPAALRRVTGDDALADLLEGGAMVRAVGTGRSPGLGDIGAIPPGVEPRAATEVRTVELDGLDPRTVVLLLSSPSGVVADDPSLVAPSPEEDRQFITRAPLSSDQTEAIDRLDARRAPSIAELEALAPSADGPIQVSRTYDHSFSPFEIPWDLIAVGISVLVALLVISVALALSAADGRSDDQVVAAVGAPPTVVRRRRALEAAFTAAGAAVLGIGVAGAATLTVIHSPTISPSVGRSEIRIPFVDLSIALFLPVVAIGGITWLVLAVSAAVRGRRDLFLVDG